MSDKMMAFLTSAGAGMAPSVRKWRMLHVTTRHTIYTGTLQRDEIYHIRGYIWPPDGFMSSAGAGMAPSVKRQGTACNQWTSSCNHIRSYRRTLQNLTVYHILWFPWLHDGFMPSAGAGMTPSVRRYDAACRQCISACNSVRGESVEYQCVSHMLI